MFKCGLCVLIVFDVIIGHCSVGKTDVPPEIEKGSCPVSPHEPAAHLDVHFQTKVLPNEFIVKFRNFYQKSTREKFLRAVLQRANISSWEVLQRHNPASGFPSDFDILRLVDNNILAKKLGAILESHPTIKNVTPHRQIQRSLSYVPSNNVTDDERFSFNVGRRLLRALPRQITTTLQANVLWKLGITGKGVKVAVFDTGLARDHPHFRRVKERTNWTNEKSLDDGVSHGTFVAGVIASTKECLGFAPDAELHIYRVFTNTQVSYTSWFLDAFNYAIFRKINILNLSIGGPDFLDHPFVDKVLELSANKVIMVSAIGNDGPLYGTLNNPGDQSDVIGVGGINFDEKVAKFSSRGMTTWELPLGYGRLKPDIVTYGSQVKGSNVRAGCRSLSGTSVASPVVAGAISLITSGALHKMKYINPSSMKQVLIEGASQLRDNNMFEQGHGKLNILQSMKLLSTYIPKVTLSPAYLDFTESYMWPYSSQPLFCGSMSVIVNITILNGIAVTGKIVEQPKWHPYADKNGNLLQVAISFSPVLWPWSGWMAVHLGVNGKGCDFEGIARGHVSLVVQNPSFSDESKSINSTVYFPLTVKIIQRPPRHKRILWDQYHSLRYPPGYIPRDNLKIKSDPLDWRADHIHTNFRDMYNHLRNSGYYIDILRMPYTCFNASDYGTLLLVDPEEEYFDEEIVKLQNDVYDAGISVVVFADWYNTTVMKKIKFFDENTRQWWIPDTGGTNVPALNDLLKPFGIALDDFVAEGHFRLGDHAMYFASGATIAKSPNNIGNIIIGAELNDQGAEIIQNLNAADKIKRFVPILGLFQTKHNLRKKYVSANADIAPSSYEENTFDQSDLEMEVSRERNPIINKRILLKVDTKKSGAKDYSYDTKKLTSEVPKHDLKTDFSEGRIAIFGDSSCLDSTHLEKACFWLLDALLEFTMNSHTSGLLQNLNRISEFEQLPNKVLPLRLASSNLHQYSKILDSNNKYKKMPIEKCENLQWCQGNIVNSSELKILMDAAKEDLVSNYQKNKDILLTEFKDSNLIDFHSKINKESLKEIQFGETFNTFEDDSINLSLVFVIVLTFLVLILFINWFKRRKPLSPFIL